MPSFILHSASADCASYDPMGVFCGIDLYTATVGRVYTLHIFGIPTPSLDEAVGGAVLPAVILFGLLHGLSPGHGWPVAILYSMRTPRPMLYGLISSGIIAGAHFISAIVVVVAYIFLTTLVTIPNLYLRLSAAVALGILAYIFWKEEDEEEDDEHYRVESQQESLHETTEHPDHYHHHEHEQHEPKAWYQRISHHTHSHSHIQPYQKRKQAQSLKAIAGFAFVLGFAHEEEFVILALAAGAGDPVGLMIAYAGSVAAALVGVTLLSLKVYEHIQHRVMKYSKYLPKITAVLLLIMAISFATGIGIG
ncbi:MAG TPA: nickel/cobalt transporter [Nitrososphaera sp.]|nr:nickel/cobalt transporter [Nitrososphaera sp.]